jgi:hypothetical protein
LARYWLPISVPLGAVAAVRSGGFLRRLLRAWGIVAVIGVVGGLATGLVPADRFVTFAYVLPIGSAIGIVWLWPMVARRSRVLAGGLAAVVMATLLGGAAVTWLRARPFVTPAEVTVLARASSLIDTVPRGTPLVFVVDNRSPTISFFATQAGNAIRGAVPPDRIRDVFVYVGSPDRYVAGRPTLVGPSDERAAAIHDALSRRYLRDIQSAGGHPVAFVLRPFDPAGFRAAQERGTGTLAAPGVVIMGRTLPHGGNPNGTAASVGPLVDDAPAPVSSWWIVAIGVALPVFLGLVGLGWALASTADPVAAVAVAPSFGAAALLLGGVAVDRLGATLSGSASLAVSAVVAVGGYAVAYVVRRDRRDRDGVERHTSSDPSEERDPHPAE